MATDGPPADERPAADRRRRVRLDAGYSAEAIRVHLERQHGVPAGYVKLDDDTLVAEGFDAQGEGDDCER